MGCFNQTCMITQLPIRAGDPVRLLVLIEGRYSGGRVAPTGPCYGHETWTLVGMPVLGEYDDYGRAENLVDGPELQSVYAALGLGWPEVDPSAYAGDRLCDWVSEGADVDDPLGTGKSKAPTYPYRTRRPADNYQEEYRKTGKVPQVEVERVLRLGYALVHEPVYQALIAGVDTLDYEAPGALRARLAATHEAMPAAVEAAKSMEQSRLRVTQSERRGPECSLFTMPFMLGLEDRIWEDAAGFAAWYERLDDPTWRAASLNAHLFHYGVGLARRQYMPQAGQGSQGVYYDLHRAVLRAAADVIETNEREQATFDAEWASRTMAADALTRLTEAGHVPSGDPSLDILAVMALGYRWDVAEDVWISPAQTRSDVAPSSVRDLLPDLSEEDDERSVTAGVETPRLVE